MNYTCNNNFEKINRKGKITERVAFHLELKGMTKWFAE